jgi:hypothetical protein
MSELPPLSRETMLESVCTNGGVEFGILLQEKVRVL